MQTNSFFPNIWVQLGLNWHIMQIAIPSKDFAPLVHKICTIRTEFKGGRDYIVVEWLLDNRTTKQGRPGLTHFVQLLVDRPQIVTRSTKQIINMTTRKLIPTTKYIQLKKSEILNRQRKYFGVRTKVSCGNVDIGNAPITDQIV